MKKQLLKLTYSAMCVALAMVLPLVTFGIPMLGKFISPMHIPVFLCGFLCGWPWGLVVGAVCPLLRHLIFGMPGAYDAIVMTFELAAYGALSGLLYHIFPKKPLYIYLTLILSMIGGRIVLGAASFIAAGVSHTTLTMGAFITGSVLVSWPGMILHIVLVPLIVLALQRAKLVLNE